MPAVSPDSVIAPPNRKVLYCLEDTEADFNHFEWVLGHWFKDDDHITIADVKHKPKSKAHTPDSWAAQIDDEKSFTKTRIAQHINDLCAKTNRHLDINVIVECEEKAGHYLVHLADELKPDVILVGSKERKGLIKGLFKENVGRYVAKHADAAVVAVKDLEHPLNAAGTDTGGVGVWGATGLPAPIGHNVDEVVKLGETHPVVHEQHHHQHPIDPKIPGANAWVAPGHVTPDAPTNAGINAKIVM